MQLPYVGPGWNVVSLGVKEIGCTVAEHGQGTWTSASGRRPLPHPCSLCILLTSSVAGAAGSHENCQVGAIWCFWSFNLLAVQWSGAWVARTVYAMSQMKFLTRRISPYFTLSSITAYVLRFTNFFKAEWEFNASWRGHLRTLWAHQLEPVGVFLVHKQRPCSCFMLFYTIILVLKKCRVSHHVTRFFVLYQYR